MTAGADESGSGRTRNPVRTRAEILKAAREEFCAKGLNGARVDAIAARAGANKRMLYHYFGNKEDLYSAVLLDAYLEIRSGEREMNLSRHSPVEAMEQLVRFTFRHFLANPWFPRLLAIENLHNARFLKRIGNLPAINSPLVAGIAEILRRGSDEGVFRSDVDPVQLYVSIAGLSYFYVSNSRTLSVIFERDFESGAMIEAREIHAIDVILSYLTAPPARQGPADSA